MLKNLKYALVEHRGESEIIELFPPSRPPTLFLVYLLARSASLARN